MNHPHKTTDPNILAKITRPGDLSKSHSQSMAALQKRAEEIVRLPADQQAVALIKAIHASRPASTSERTSR